jgi:hypothetical protein
MTRIFVPSLVFLFFVVGGLCDAADKHANPFDKRGTKALRLPGTNDARAVKGALTAKRRSGGAAAPADAEWMSMGGFPGVDGVVNAVATDDSGNLYVGGRFLVAGSVVANNIAKWDGVAWSGLGGGTDSSVLSLAIDRLGNVYAGGRFHRAGAVSVNHIAKWDGGAWSALGGGVLGWAASVPALSIDRAGKVFAARYFDMAGSIAARNIAKWDGNAWSALGSGLNSPYRQFSNADAPYVLALSADTFGNLFAGGWFDSAGGVPASRVAKWNGSAWSALGSGVNNKVTSLATDKKGNLYTGGKFDTAGGVSAKRFAWWNGAAWSAFDTLQMSVWATEVAVIVDKSDSLYALGEYFIAKRRSGKWNTVVDLTISSLYCAAADNAGNIYLGGGSLTVGGPTLNAILKWNGGSLGTLGRGTDGTVAALLSDGSGAIYAGGYFSEICGTPAKCIAKWSGGTWSSLGQGISGGVAAMAMDKGGGLYVAGTFDSAGGIPARNIAKWNGSAWNTVGGGITGGGTPSVNAIAVDNAGNVYAGGYFSGAGGVPARNIAKWDGTVWSALDSGISLCEDCDINVLTVDHAGSLLVAGRFGKAGNVNARNIAKWDGTAWSGLAGTIDFEIFALALTRSGALYAGGYCEYDNRPVFKWDGGGWSSLGKGMDGSVHSLALDSAGNLYAGGYFDSVYKELDSAKGAIAAGRIAKWNGVAWSALGSGLAGYRKSPDALVYDGAGALFAGGDFSVAGGKVSPCIARYAIDKTADKVPGRADWRAASASFDRRSGVIRFSLRSAAYASCRMFTLSGREVGHASGNFPQGGHTLRITTAGLAMGAFIVHFSAAGESAQWLMSRRE